MTMTDDQKREIMEALAITLEVLTDSGQIDEQRRRDAASAIRMIYHFFETGFQGGQA